MARSQALILERFIVSQMTRRKVPTRHHASCLRPKPVRSSAPHFGTGASTGRHPRRHRQDTLTEHRIAVLLTSCCGFAPCLAFIGEGRNAGRGERPPLGTSADCRRREWRHGHPARGRAPKPHGQDARATLLASRARARRHRQSGDAPSALGSRFAGRLVVRRVLECSPSDRRPGRWHYGAPVSFFHRRVQWFDDPEDERMPTAAHFSALFRSCSVSRRKSHVR